MKSSCKQIDKKITIIPTDKSGRFAVLIKKQFLEAGKLHTEKIKKSLGWR